jgi:hypothetical protein
MYAQTEMFSKSQDFTATTSRLEEVPAIYYAYTGQPIVIQAGDFIKARGTLCMGLVLRIGSIKAGKATIQGYVIQDCHGKEDFIDEGSAQFIAR